MLLMMNTSTIFTCQNHVVCYINDRKYYTSTSNLFLSNPMTFQPPLCLKNPQKPFHSSHLLRAFTGKNNEQKWIHQGIITESLPDLMFRVRLDNGEEDPILGYLSGKMKMNHIRLLVGDKVTVELSRYDSTRGRIIYRQDSKDRTDKPPKKVKKKGSQNKKTRS